MIILSYPKYNQKIADWEAKLVELVVAHRLKEDTTLHAPILNYGSIQYEGEQAINAFFPKLAEEIAAWRDDSCGG